MKGRSHTAPAAGFEGNLRPPSEALADLETELSRVHAPVLAALRPGLTAETMRRVTRPLPFPPGDALVALYAWHDGSGGDGPAEELFPGGRFPSLERAVEAYFLEVKLANEVAQATGLDPATSYAQDWFPVFVTGGGDRFVVTQGGRGAVLLLDRVDSSGNVEEAESLAALLEQLVERFQAGAYAPGPGGGLVVDDAVLARLRRTHRGAVPNHVALLNQLQGRIPDAQNRAFQEIERMRDPELVEPLIGLLSSSDRVLRRRVALLLGAIGDPRAIPHLIRALAAWEGEDHASAWGGLQAIGHEGVIGHLEAALRDGPAEIRAAAVRALATTLDARAVPALQAAAKDRDLQVRAAAEGALRKLGL